MGDVQRVDPGALYGQAGEMMAQQWHNPNAEAVVPPDALPSSSAAVANLNDNAKSLLEFQEWAEKENRRIAEMLQTAADAYQRVDETYGRVITDPGRRAAVEAIPIPAPATAPPATPTPVGAPRTLDASGYSDVHKTQAELTSPDDGSSLKVAMLQWAAAARHVEAKAPRPPGGDWEGEAADAAYSRMTEFEGHLRQLSEGWADLAVAAAKVLEAHGDAKSRHADIHGEYVKLEKRLNELAAQTTAENSIATQSEMEKIQSRMRELQQQSDEVRQDYAHNATFSPVRPEMPAGGGADRPGTVGGNGGGGGGGQQPTGDPAGMAEKMAHSLGGEPQSGAGGGATPVGAGAPSSSGAPSAGSGVGAGTPSGTAPSARPPTDPSLRPAAASRGSGSGGGAGAGAGGGGMPATPMSAPVTAETVAPAPTTPAAASAGAGPSADGRAAGGMGGGMAPMGHGAGAQQGKEKRRDPRLAPDEDLYTEDRPWTEAVIGNRRRREVGDGREGRDAT
ncbi:hypothetical protein QGN32_12340 [Mycolicibacterium sp. ND9-15]|uniref:PPE domain-containing protein n=1 Tax=Mycolicibacterium sp. ND9-15 TaxID=3042320 RepID=UPI002DDB272A|nr:hypothetical protein [Mycolicibacterium sp. ND9-15]WSE58574.1 hypothetical protein QGN32_12340 [Mycolicibacterium sp. ND9-15]